VKTNTIKTVIPAIMPMVSDTTVIINLQDGVDNKEHLAETYGLTCVMGGAAYILTLLEARALSAR
jgi:ketopantoate reductase